MKILDCLVEAVRSAAVFDSAIDAAPACILWPDRDRQWESVHSALCAELPELLTLGDYDPEKQIGPAIWLRCAIAGQIPEVEIPDGLPPILYLPGVSRQDLRAVEICPPHIKPLAEFQYRGVFWSQQNAKDWTVLAYLVSHFIHIEENPVAQKGALRTFLRPLSHRFTNLLILVKFYL